MTDHEFHRIARGAQSAIENGYRAGVTSDGRAVYHVLSDQGTLLRYWFTLNPCLQVIGFATQRPWVGDCHPEHFDIRECADPAISAAVAHWSGHRPVVLS